MSGLPETVLKFSTQRYTPRVFGDFDRNIWIWLLGKQDVSKQPTNFRGCRVHGSFYGGQTGKKWDTDGMSCSDFISSGQAFVINVYQSIPPGKYCGTLWFNHDGAYASAGATCNEVG